MWIYAVVSSSIHNLHIKINVYISHNLFEAETVVGIHYHILHGEKFSIAKTQHCGYAIYNDVHTVEKTSTSKLPLKTDLDELKIKQPEQHVGFSNAEQIL